MKLYVDENEVLLDYSDVEPNAPLDKAAMEYRDFIREYGGERTIKPKIKRLIDGNRTNMNGYMQVLNLLGNLNKIRSDVRSRRDYIDLDESFTEYRNAVEERCRELYEAEREKEARRKIAERWKHVCKHGCKGCSELCRTGFDDGYACRSTGEELETRNIAGFRGGVYVLYNYVPFPSKDCPLNIEKTKELVSGKS